MGKRKANTNDDERATFDDFFNDVKNGLSSEDLGNSVDGWVENFNNAIFGDSDDEEDEEDGTEMGLDLDDLEDETDFEDEELDDDEMDFEDEELDDDETDFKDADEIDVDEDELDEDDCCKCGCGHCNCCDDDDEDDEELEDYDYLGMYLNVLECLRDNGIPVEQAIEYLKDSDLCYEAALDSVQMLMNKLEPVDIIKIAMRGLV